MADSIVYILIIFLFFGLPVVFGLALLLVALVVLGKSPDLLFKFGNYLVDFSTNPTDEVASTGPGDSASLDDHHEPNHGAVEADADLVSGAKGRRNSRERR